MLLATTVQSLTQFCQGATIVPHNGRLMTCPWKWLRKYNGWEEHWGGRTFSAQQLVVVDWSKSCLSQTHARFFFFLCVCVVCLQTLWSALPWPPGADPSLLPITAAVMMHEGFRSEFTSFLDECIGDRRNTVKFYQVFASQWVVLLPDQGKNWHVLETCVYRKKLN